MLHTLKKVTKESLQQIEEEKRVRKTEELFLLFSLGSQFDHLIKRALEKLGVFCLVADPGQVTEEDVRKVNPIGIILSGGPASVYADAPEFDGGIFGLGIPVLGICLGFQLWAKYIGVPVTRAEKQEFGTHSLPNPGNSSLLFEGCTNPTPVLLSHGDRVEVDDRLNVLSGTNNAPVAAAQHKHLWGVQFHPEVTETKDGPKILQNFCFRICGAKDKYPAEEMAGQKIESLRKQIGDKKVLLALSGGSDSSTVAYLLKNALGEKSEQVKAIYIKGIDRPDDEEFVHKYFGDEDWLSLTVVDATKEFLQTVSGKITMHEKRVAMRGVYKSILEKEAGEFGASFILQGTLYTDISESGGGYNIGVHKARIKLHHNTDLSFSLPEIIPLSDCVKDSGRNIGRSIGVPEDLLVRHPFPGPGLLIRIEGGVDATKLAIARKVDEIYIDELRKWNLYANVWQAGAVLIQSVTTCTKGDSNASGYIVALWAVWSVNGFTARWARLPHDFLAYVSRKITNEVQEVGAVVYRISDKPPATIEWG